MSYLSLLYNNSVSKGEQCEDGYKQCGILDTVGNILCLPYNSDCPLNDIMITNSLSVPNEFKGYAHINSIQINEDSVIHYTNEAIYNPIIVDFRLSKKLPCLKHNIDDCDTKKGDGRFKLLDKMNLYTFYEVNNLFLYDAKVDWSDTKLKKKDVYLYYREYIGYDKNCIDNDDFFMKSDFFTKNKTIRKLIIVVLSFSLVALFAVPTLFAGSEEFKKLLIIIIVYIFFFLIFFLISYILSLNIPSISSCSDEYSTLLVNKLMHQKKMNQLYIHVCIHSF